MSFHLSQLLLLPVLDGEAALRLPLFDAAGFFAFGLEDKVFGFAALAVALLLVPDLAVVDLDEVRAEPLLAFFG